MYYKYPRTLHFPFSDGITSDDKVLETTVHFNNREIVVTEKMDGENSTIYRDYYHARSLSSEHKWYHSWLLGYVKTFQYLIPENYRICGEYLFARHSIKYENLKSYFQVFSVWNENICLSWDETESFCNQLGLETVPVLYRGLYDEDKIKEIAKEVVSKGGEGIVVRLSSSFKYEDFPLSIAKYVRKNHLQTDKHWSLGIIEENKLKKV